MELSLAWNVLSTMDVARIVRYLETSKLSNSFYQGSWELLGAIYRLIGRLANLY